MLGTCFPTLKLFRFHFSWNKKSFPAVYLSSSYLIVQRGGKLRVLLLLLKNYKYFFCLHTPNMPTFKDTWDFHRIWITNWIILHQDSSSKHMDWNSLLSVESYSISSSASKVYNILWKGLQRTPVSCLHWRWICGSVSCFLWFLESIFERRNSHPILNTSLSSPLFFYFFLILSVS